MFPECSRAEWPTVGVQQSGDLQLFLCDAEGLLQVLLVAPGSGFGQIHQVGPQSVLDRQEHHPTPPAGFEVFHIYWTASSEGKRLSVRGSVAARHIYKWYRSKPFFTNLWSIYFSLWWPQRALPQQILFKIMLENLFFSLSNFFSSCFTGKTLLLKNKREKVI